jgi:hypothetical protein
MIKISNFEYKTAKKLLPLAFIFFGNLLFGLGGTKSLK